MTVMAPTSMHLGLNASIGAVNRSFQVHCRGSGFHSAGGWPSAEGAPAAGATADVVGWERSVMGTLMAAAD
ncbi:hypothetical protein LBMAG53_22290 [Planctomycetota bacterium]|nr:hypothetical protein LBMAG53_22290 [Planctomycetota bacterium]